MRYRIWMTLLILGAGWAMAGELDLGALFEKPVALLDAGGKPLLTGLAEGCPFAADFNGDGKIDIILGAHENMDTAVGGIWLIPNTGTNEKPVFNWAGAIRVSDANGPIKVGCG
jgi:hypothetical protein